MHQKLAWPAVTTRRTDSWLNLRLYSAMIRVIAESTVARRGECTTSSTKLGSCHVLPSDPRHPPSATQNVNPSGRRELTTSFRNTDQAESVTMSESAVLRPR